MLRTFPFCLILILSLSLQAQKNVSHTQNADIFAILNDSKTGPGKIQVKREDNINTLFYKHIEFNRKQNGVMGYRIRIFSDSGQPAKQKAMTERSRFVKDHADFNAYLVYDTPNFKIYVGDFRTKSEALKLFKQIKKDFPKAFIVNEVINTVK